MTERNPEPAPILPTGRYAMVTKPAYEGYYQEEIGTIGWGPTRWIGHVWRDLGNPKNPPILYHHMNRWQNVGFAEFTK